MKTSLCTRRVSCWLLAAWLGGLVLTFSGCSPGGDPALIGKWQEKESKEILEIRRDGTWVEGGKPDPDIISCKWAWDGTNRIRLTVKTKIVGTVRGTMKVTLQGDTLILKDEDGATEYTRVK